jgi:hypothetical protein
MFMYEAMICKPKAGVWKMFDEMQERMKDEHPQKVETLIDEAVTETRNQRTGKKALKRG